MSCENQAEKTEEKPNKPLPIKKCADLQRLKLEKLMKNFDKPIIIPERPKDKNVAHVPEFIRNVMGSSAGAGSGEFHVYRHLRRKEYARQKYIQLKSEKEKLDEAYKKKLEENARRAEERTAKKRAKRLKKKEKMKNRKKKPKLEKIEEGKVESSETEDENEDEENDGNKNEESRADKIEENEGDDKDNGKISDEKQNEVTQNSEKESETG